MHMAPRFKFAKVFFCGHVYQASVADGAGAVAESRKQQAEAAKQYCPGCKKRQAQQAAAGAREW